MALQVGLLSIERIIVHDVPKHTSASTGVPILTEAESLLNDDLRAFFNQCIRGSLKRGMDVLSDPTTASPVPPLIGGQLSSQETDFVEMSQHLARHLYGVQNGSNPAGILAVIQARQGEVPSVVILKLERQTGVSLEPTIRDQLSTFDLVQIRNLMMSEDVKVFKAAGFVADGEADPTPFPGFQGIVSDSQRGLSQSPGVASFFLERFLGCKYRERPSIITQRFLEQAERYINDSVTDAQTRARYVMSVVSELESNDGEIDVPAFIYRHFVGEDRQHFENQLREAGVPIARFRKDTELVRNRLRMVHVQYQSGLILMGKPDVLDNHVRFIEMTDGSPITEIRDEVANVTAKRR